MVEGTRSWLKISGIPIGTSNRQRRKEEVSACIKGVPKPSIFTSFDWIERDVCWRALQIEHAPSPASSPSAFPARHLPSISDAWIHGLRQALADLAKVEATHFIVMPIDFSNEIRLRFGNDAPHQAVECVQPMVISIGPISRHRRCQYWIGRIGVERRVAMMLQILSPVPHTIPY